MSKTRLTLEIVKDRLNKINPNIEILSNEYKNSTTKLKCRCLIDGYEWYISWNKLQQGRGCPECGGVRTDYTIEDIKNKLNVVNPNIKIMSDKYIGAGEKLKCKCLIDNHIWYSNWRNLQSGKGCPICGIKKISKAKRLCLDEKKRRLRKINPNIEVLGESFKNGRSILKCRCLIDNCIWEAIWNNLSKGQGCPDCKNKKTGDRCRLTLDEVKEEIYNINPFIEILSTNYKDTHRSKLKCRCLICNNIWETTRTVLIQGCGCIICINSKGERKVLKYLKDNNIANIVQYSFEDCRSKNPLKFDFYLPKHNACIEYDGEQHFKLIDFAGKGKEWAKEQYKSILARDIIKNTYCRNNNIKLLRIPYTEFDNIDDILDGFLNNYTMDSAM